MTRDNLILFFTKVVKQYGTPGAMTDFEKYDRDCIKDMVFQGFNFIFVQYHHGSTVVVADATHYFNQICKKEAVRYTLARSIEDYHLSGRPISKAMRYYFVDVRNGLKVTECSRDEANEIYRNAVMKAITDYRLIYPGMWPTKKDLKMRLQFNCTFSYLREQLSWAEKHGDKSLLNVFHRLKKYVKFGKKDVIRISKGDHDRAFWVETPSYVGQICYHGYKGEADRSFSHRLEPNKDEAWSLHT